MKTATWGVLLAGDSQRAPEPVPAEESHAWAR